MDKDFDKFLSKIQVPVVAELFVLLIFFYESRFSVFLNESEEYSCGPFFSMEIEKLRGSFCFWLGNIFVKLRVLQIDDEGNQVHPVNYQLFHSIINFIMYGFPEEFGHKVN